MSDVVVYFIGLVPSFIIFIFFMHKVKNYDKKVVDLMDHINKQNVMIYDHLKKDKTEIKKDIQTASKQNTPSSKSLGDGVIKWG